MGMHGAEIQVCKVPLDKGWKLKARLVNDSGHGHRAGVTARRDDGQIADSATFRVVETGGRARSSRWWSSRARQPSAGVSEDDDSGGAGGSFTLGSVARC